MAHILIIEDDPDFRFLLRNSLEEAGHSCAEISRGDIARDEARRLAKERCFDLLIVDGWFLPGKKGADVCRDLRATPEFKEDPLLVISVEGRDFVEPHLAGVRIDEFMRKPVVLADVVNKVSALLSMGKGGQP